MYRSDVSSFLLFLKNLNTKNHLIWQWILWLEKKVFAFENYSFHWFFVIQVFHLYCHKRYFKCFTNQQRLLMYVIFKIFFLKVHLFWDFSCTILPIANVIRLVIDLNLWHYQYVIQSCLPLLLLLFFIPVLFYFSCMCMGSLYSQSAVYISSLS